MLNLPNWHEATQHMYSLLRDVSPGKHTSDSKDSRLLGLLQKLQYLQSMSSMNENWNDGYNIKLYGKY